MVHESVRAREFVLVDMEDRPVAVLAPMVDDNGATVGAGLAFIDGAGRQPITVSFREGVGPGLVIRDPAGDTVLVIGLDDGPPR